MRLHASLFAHCLSSERPLDVTPHGQCALRDGEDKLLLSHTLEEIEAPAASQAQGVGMCVGPVSGAVPMLAGEVNCIYTVAALKLLMPMGDE